MILTYKVKHGRDFSEELKKAIQVAKFGVANKDKHICKSCNEEFLKESFYKNRSRKSGYDFTFCKKCKREYMKSYFKTSGFDFKSAYKKYLVKNPHYSWAKSTIKAHKRDGYAVNFKPKELADIARKITVCPICSVILKWNQGGSDGKLKRESPTLDRINNEKILDLQTVQIVCHSCNTTKSYRTMVEFVEYCEMVAEKFAPRKKQRNETIATLEPHRL